MLLFRYYIFALGLLTKLLTLLFMCLSYKYYRLPVKSSTVIEPVFSALKQKESNEDLEELDEL